MFAVTVVPEISSGSITKCYGCMELDFIEPPEIGSNVAQRIDKLRKRMRSTGCKAVDKETITVNCPGRCIYSNLTANFTGKNI